MPKIENKANNLTYDDLVQDLVQEEQKQREKYKIFFEMLALIFFVIAAVIILLSLYEIVYLLYKYLIKEVFLSQTNNEKIFISSILKALQPIIVGFAISQFFVVSAVTTLDLKMMWLLSLNETERKESTEIDVRFKNRTKIGILLELVISTILLAFIIVYNYLIDVTKLEPSLDSILKISYLLIGSAAIFLVFRSLYFVVFERKQ